MEKKKMKRKMRENSLKYFSRKDQSFFVWVEVNSVHRSLGYPSMPGLMSGKSLE